MTLLFLRNSTLLRSWEFLKVQAICYTTIISSRKNLKSVGERWDKDRDYQQCEPWDGRKFGWRKVRCFLGGFHSSLIIELRAGGLIPSSVRCLSSGFCWCGKTPWPNPACVGKSLFQFIAVVHCEWKSGQELKARIWRQELIQSHKRMLLVVLFLWFAQSDFSHNAEPFARGWCNP